jgi:hypothetical protein
MLDEGFTASDVYFDPQELLEAFESEDYGTGDMVVLDEAGVGMGNRSWYEKSQILMNQTLQTVRDDNMGVIFTLPRLSELDSQTRGRFHAFLEMKKLHKRQGYATAKWKKVEPRRDERNDIYYPFPRLRINGAKREIKRVGIGKPPEGLVEGYEERKEAFKQALYEEAIEAYDDDDGDDEMSPKEVAEEIIDDGVSEFVSEHARNGTEYVDKEMIRVEYDLSHRDASAAKKYVEKLMPEEGANTKDAHTP